MIVKSIRINIDEPVENWDKKLLSVVNANDCIVCNASPDALVWFTTNYTQLLARKGGNEVVPIYGKPISDLESFLYQVNLSLPVGYRMATRLDALYDLLLNFETEPKGRILIWNDADFLYKKAPEVFADIFESMIVAAYCNRHSISTIKEDGTRYTVDQRNIFLFNGDMLQEIEPLTNKEYHIPSIDNPEGLYKQIDFHLIELIE